MNGQTETLPQPASAPIEANEMTGASPGAVRLQNMIAPQSAGGTCSCGAAPNAGIGGMVSFVYAIGRVEARFPNLAAEKEFAQATGRTDTAGMTDQQTFHTVLSKPEHRYLRRQICWVFIIQGLETYLLTPRDPADIDLLVEAIRPAPSPNDIDVVIGLRGPIAPPEMCNGLIVPIVAFDQIYSFDRESLIKAIPRPEKTSDEEFGRAAEELFGRILQLADNAGDTEEHRALNYLAMRYPGIYAKTAEQFRQNFSLTGVEVRPVAPEHYPENCGCNLLLHQPEHGFHGKVFCTC